MALINEAAKLYMGSQPAVAAYKGSVKVWPPAVANTLAASLRLMDPAEVPGATAPWVQVTTAYSGVAPSLYRYYTTTNWAGWVLRHVGNAGPHNFDTTYSSVVMMSVDAFDAAGNFMENAITNAVNTPAAPVVNVARTAFCGVTAAASYNGSNVKRTDTDGVNNCYYGYYSSTQGNQKSLVIFAIPADVRNCVSIESVQVQWYNNHHFANSGGKVSMVAHHGSSLPASFPGSTGVLLSGGAQVKWAAPKPGYIGGGTPPNAYLNIGDLTSSGRPSIKEEIRVHGMTGLGLYPAESGQAGYGYGATNPTLYIAYTVRV